MTLTDRLAGAYRRHFEWHREFKLSARQPTRALGWEATLWLVNALTARGAQWVLECGSGWSTTALRLWAQESPSRVVVTTDHRKNWLNRSRKELEREGLPIGNMHVHETFIGQSQAFQFDAVLVDLADTPTREREFDNFLRLLRPHGLLVFDDWHIASYVHAITDAFRGRGLSVPVAVPETRDDFGRFLAVWPRA